MRLFSCAAMIAMMCCSSCMALDQETSKPPKTKPITRVMAFGKQVTGALTELAHEVVPVVKAMNDEVSSEMRTDMAKVREEVSLQMRRPIPSRANPTTP